MVIFIAHYLTYTIAMSKRITKLNLPRFKPEKYLELCTKVKNYNTTLGAASPFADGSIVDMAEFNNLLSRANDARQKALDLYAEAEARMYESRQLMGFAKGQTSQTNGTLNYMLCKIKNLLLVLENENPEALSVWGFDVTIKTAKPRGKKKAG